MGILQSFSNKQVETDSSEYSSTSHEEEAPKTTMASSTSKKEVNAQCTGESDESESEEEEEEDSSSSNEEDDNHGESEGSQSESEKENEKSSEEVKDSKQSASDSKVPSKKKLCLPLLDTPAADDEESDGSTSESEEGTPTIKTMEIVPKSKTPSKRPAEDNEDVSHATSRKKLAVSILEKSNKVSVAQSEKTVFKRVWSEQDEITILEGMIEYKSTKGIEPNANLQAFFNFIKDSLQYAGNKVQLTDKIKHLKCKYKRYVEKPQTIREPHGMKVHKLSKKIWGNVQLVVCGASGEVSAGQEIQENAIPMSKISELHEMPRELEGQEVELLFQKLHVMIEQARQLVLKSLKKSWIISS